MEEYNNAMKGDSNINFVYDPCLMAELPNISLEDSFSDQIKESFHLDDSHPGNESKYEHFDCFKQRGLLFLHLNARV